MIRLHQCGTYFRLSNRPCHKFGCDARSRTGEDCKAIDVIPKRTTTESALRTCLHLTTWLRDQFYEVRSHVVCRNSRIRPRLFNVTYELRTSLAVFMGLSPRTDSTYHTTLDLVNSVICPGYVFGPDSHRRLVFYCSLHTSAKRLKLVSLSSDWSIHNQKRITQQITQKYFKVISVVTVSSGSFQSRDASMPI